MSQPPLPLPPSFAESTSTTTTVGTNRGDGFASVSVFDHLCGMSPAEQHGRKKHSATAASTRDKDREGEDGGEQPTNADAKSDDHAVKEESKTGANGGDNMHAEEQHSAPEVSDLVEM